MESGGESTRRICSRPRQTERLSRGAKRKQAVGKDSVRPPAWYLVRRLRHNMRQRLERVPQQQQPNYQARLVHD